MSCGEGSGAVGALQPGAEEAEAVAGGGEDEVDGVAGGAGEEIAAEMPSCSMWPITGSIPARRLISRRMVGLTPRFWPERKTRCLSASWPRWPRSTQARVTDTPVMRSV